MIEPAPHHRFVRHAQQLLALGTTDQVLAELCAQALALSRARRAYASLCLPRQSWTDGTHVESDGPGAREAGPAARSALFAVHRRVVACGRELEIAHADDTAAIYRALCCGPDETIRAIPIVHRTGRIWGELVMVGGDGAHLATLGDLAQLATLALENAQKLTFARRDQDRLLLLAEATDDALYDWNTDTHDFWWGGGIRRLLGSDSAPFENTPSWKRERVHPEDIGRVHDSFEAARRANAMRWEAEYRFRRCDNSYCHVEDRAYFLRDVEGRAYRIIGSMRDVSVMKELLIREQAASHAKDEFLAMLGHELRNPLAPIVTGLELLRLRPRIDPARDLQVLERQARHLIRLVDDLLDISRIAHGKIQLERELHEVSAAVTAAIETAGPMIDGRRHTLHIDVPATGIVMFADRARLTQAIGNIVMNAAKYTAPGGDIWITARRTGDQAEIRVRDNGIGIDREMLPHIFKMFVQERQALDRSQGGLGLGLAIVHNLIALHGGTVEPHSEGRGRGTELTIRLPLAAPAIEPRLTTTQKRAQQAPGRRILVVDDNEDAADMLAMILEQFGNTTRVAHDAEQALQVAGEFTPDVAVLDIGLPVVDGYELARRLRGRMHLIALSGYGQASDKERSRDAGFDAHLVKPVEIDQLRELIVTLTA